MAAGAGAGNGADADAGAGGVAGGVAVDAVAVASVVVLWRYYESRLPLLLVLRRSSLLVLLKSW